MANFRMIQENFLLVMSHVSITNPYFIPYLTFSTSGFIFVRRAVTSGSAAGLADPKPPINPAVGASPLMTRQRFKKPTM